jgi:regulator of protease activity HflC (stomatin/prohibitin superfamily)
LFGGDLRQAHVSGEDFMDIIFSLLFIAAIIGLSIGFLYILGSFKQITIFDYERGVVYRRGRFHRILSAGAYWLFTRIDTIQKIDIRTRFLTIPGQEILSSDNISVKVSIALSFRVDDPQKALSSTANYTEALYLIMQLGMRDLFSATPIESLLAERPAMSKKLFEETKDKVSEIGLTLLSADLKDFMFPGEMKNLFAQIVGARNEGLAALERARGESAALRNLANAAKMLENNPALMQLRILQTLEKKSGNTIILSTSPDVATILPASRKK